MVRRSVLAIAAAVAVGYSFSGSADETLVMAWDGSAWSIVSSPNAGTISDRLSSVSCVSVSDCVAVGNTVTGSGSAVETLVMVWNGTVWSIVSSPNAGTTEDFLSSVSCVSVSDCVAVGSTYTGSAYETLAMVWDGTDWSIVPSPNAGASGDQLRSVSCVSATQCVAVGNSSTDPVTETLVMVWDGIVWSVVSSPNAGTSNDVLRSVSCVSASECVAVGTTRSDSPDETLVVSLTGPVPPSTTTTASSQPVTPAFTG